MRESVEGRLCADDVSGLGFLALRGLSNQVYLQI